MLPGYNPPSRRLVVAAQTSDRWFIHYEHGGVGHHSHLVVYLKAPGGWRLAYAGWASYEYHTLKDLRGALEAHKFESSRSHF